MEEAEAAAGGGTYGLIVNRLAFPPESADPAWRQIDLLLRNWEEKRSRRLEEEDGSGGGGAGGGAEGMATIYHDVPPNN